MTDVVEVQVTWDDADGPDPLEPWEDASPCLTTDHIRYILETNDTVLVRDNDLRVTLIYRIKDRKFREDTWAALVDSGAVLDDD